jgi:3-dehydroquinate dehydratase/shikimate dehydrogenase
MIIVTITGPTTNAALAQLHVSRRHADLFEFRLDRMRSVDVARLMRTARKPVVATCRPQWEGGSYTGRESERIAILEAAVRSGADYVDIELRADDEILRNFLRPPRAARVILSRHLLQPSRFNGAELYNRLRAMGPDVIKLAYAPRDVSDVRIAVDFLLRARSDGQKAVAIALGEEGEPSRILYKKFGGWATYAAPDVGSPGAPGQIVASQLKRVYRADKHFRDTRIFGVIGSPVRQSRGVFVHNALFHRIGFPGVYCRFHVSDLARFMRQMAPLLAGFSVTIPHKERVIRFLDTVDRRATAIGAVNTVVRRGGRLIGTNTDAGAALDAIEKKADVDGKRILILGAGGAARAIAYEALNRGAAVSIWNRTKRRAQLLARDMRMIFPEAEVKPVALDEVQSADFDILVNATSVGMVPRVRSSPVAKRLLRKKIVFDAVYNPPVTKLLEEAKSAGGRIIPGTAMYVGQAAAQFELFTGEKPDQRLMHRLLLAHLS